MFLVLPSVVLLATSWTSGEFLVFPPQGFSLRWYTSLFSDDGWTTAFWTSSPRYSSEISFISWRM